MPELGNVYTLAEAAEHLRMTPRGVAKIARRHGLCMINGRVITLTGADIEGIKEAMRAAPADPVDITSTSHYRELQGLMGKTKSVSPKARAILLERSKRASANKPLKEDSPKK
jgi:class 3 adenylate cyclase